MRRVDLFSGEVLKPFCPKIDLLLLGMNANMHPVMMTSMNSPIFGYCLFQSPQNLGIIWHYDLVKIFEELKEGNTTNTKEEA